MEQEAQPILEERVESGGERGEERSESPKQSRAAAASTTRTVSTPASVRWPRPRPGYVT